MKTSTRLLIILFISIPVTMFAFNWLLVNEYKAGNLSLITWAQTAEEKRELPAFKHVVMDGRFHHSKGIQPINGGLTLEIASDPGQKPLLMIPEIARKNVVIKVINDTLYISYYKKNIDVDAALYWNWHHLTLYGSKISSLTLNYGNYLILHLATDSLNLQATDAIVSVNNLTATTLNAMVHGLSTVHFYENNKVDQFEYSILDKGGKLEVTHNTSQSYKPGEVNPDAQLVLIGKAPEMQKYIMHQSSGEQESDDVPLK